MTSKSQLEALLRSPEILISVPRQRKNHWSHHCHHMMAPIAIRRCWLSTDLTTLTGSICRGVLFDSSLCLRAIRRNGLILGALCFQSEHWMMNLHRSVFRLEAQRRSRSELSSGAWSCGAIGWFLLFFFHLG